MGFGKLDFSDWIRGLFAAFIGGGATAVSGAFALVLNDPKDFNIETGMFWKTVITMFTISGFISLMMFLREKPVPGYKVVTTTTETTVRSPKTQVVERVEEVQKVELPKTLDHPKEPKV